MPKPPKKKKKKPQKEDNEIVKAVKTLQKLIRKYPQNPCYCCIVCGEKADAVGVFVPSDPETSFKLFGTRECGRVKVYPCCGFHVNNKQACGKALLAQAEEENE